MSKTKDLLYTREHEWVKLEPNTNHDPFHLYTVGITDFAQSQLGDIVYVDIYTSNESVSANDVFGTIEAVKTVSDLFMPLTGTVHINPAIEDNPELVNTDPYGEGWLIQIEIPHEADSNLENEIDDLLNWEEYKKLIE